MVIFLNIIKRHSDDNHFTPGGKLWSGTSTFSDLYIPLAMDSTGNRLVYGQWIGTPTGCTSGPLYTSTDG